MHTELGGMISKRTDYQLESWAPGWSWNYSLSPPADWLWGNPTSYTFLRTYN